MECSGTYFPVCDKSRCEGGDDPDGGDDGVSLNNHWQLVLAMGISGVCVK